MKDYIVVNFSGGKDSTAMLLRMIELGEQIDEVLFCDTYKEFPAMYRHIEKIRNVVEAKGIPFKEIKSEYDFDYYMFEHMPKRKKDDFKGLSGYSWAGSRSRWCTARLKIEVLDKYLKELRKTKNVIQCVGLAADELKRLERENNKNENHRHPLVEWGWTEADCLNYCYSLGYDWEGLYTYFNRVSCWCCPLQSLDELRKLRKYFPTLWDELRQMDKKTWRQFRADYSVEDLEKRFQFEEQRIADNKSIRNREFFKELRDVIAYGN